ncbi:LytR/AlgR family response regulator transcription factor [Flectobacillus major]|jgi:DNA-binding LytR/AlgR family response regulator|uniref:LytR/AlgR family response regulator transcription factor n=1 Tax=Flectobacillus major TaxID=103 RepID=UPI000409C0D5|nr:LytTR family DNA-binding domain-containing protein [Flectobacillus major]
MTSIKAIALDDEPPALKVLASLCSTVDRIELLKTFTRPSEAHEYLKNNPVDLLFLDINMPSITGIEFFNSIQQPILLIFTTAFSEYALEGFNLQAIDYLLKPITPERFRQACEKAILYFENIHKKELLPNFINIRADYALHKIATNEIWFVEALDDYIKIHYGQPKPIVARMTLKTILQKLPPEQFVRIHKSYIVAFNKITHIRNRVAYLEEFKIPIGQTYEKELFNKLRT